MSATLNHEAERDGTLLKRIGLFAGAILASMCLAGAISSTASAEQVGFFLAGEESEVEAEQPRFEVENENYPVDLEGPAEGEHTWGFTVGDLTCPVDFNGGLSGPASDLTLATFVYRFSCSSAPYGGSGFTIFAHGCADTVSLLNAGPPYVGQFGVTCPGENPYQFNFPVTETVTCTISIPEQNGLDEVSFENLGEGAEQSVKVGFEVTGLKYTITGGPKLICKSGEYEDGTYSGTVTLDAFEG